MKLAGTRNNLFFFLLGPRVKVDRNCELHEKDLLFQISMKEWKDCEILPLHTCLQYK